VPKYTLTILASMIGLAIVVLSMVPLSLPPLNTNALDTDKIAHFLAYFIFSTCLGLALSFDWRLKKIKLIVFVGAFCFGTILELIQGYHLLHRTFDLFDLLANLVGICTFVFSGKTIEKIVVKSGIFIN